MFTCFSSYLGLGPGFLHFAAVALLLPPFVITLLLICTTAVALLAERERSERARLILVDLLDALQALFRCNRSKR